MVLWSATTIGFILILGFIGGTMIYFLRGALNTEDSVRVDADEKNNEET